MKRELAKQKAQELLSKMTTEEKVAQMLQVTYTDGGREEALKWAKMGAGSFLHVLGDDARELQKEAMNTRLGIPVLFGIDAIHGHGLNTKATIFPSQLACACSWDPEVAKKMGEVTAREVATDGLHWTFSPVLCLGRDTRWGRVNETFGEDPYLTGELAAAIIEGYQGEDLSDDEHILACAKHYLGYGEATGARDAYDTEVTERKIREVFLPPFKRAVDVGCATIMTAYGCIDGTPLTAHRRILHDILRDELGFDGFVITDWDNTNSLLYLQHVAKDMVEASVMAASAGNDMIMTTKGFYDGMLTALREGKADISVVEECVLHILTIKYEMELFDKPEKKGEPGCFGKAEHLAASLDAARKSVTLLRNNGMLPLGGIAADGCSGNGMSDGESSAKALKRVAVIGENADNVRAQYGDWTYFTHPMPDPTNSRPAHRPYVTLWEGVKALCDEQGIEAVYAKGCAVKTAESIDESADLDEAVRIASEADVILYAVGDVIPQFGEFADRADLDLTGRQSELFSRLKATGKPICTVFIASKPLCLGDAAEKADAVICGFNGGMFGGQALAEAIFGRINPQGKLPISFPRKTGQVPVYYNQLPGWHGEKYWDIPKTPLFTFGEGIGYSAFAYEGLSLDEDLVLRVTVKNVGETEGTETVQIYQKDVVSSLLTPVRRLIAFTKVTLAAGEAKEVDIQLKKEDFALVNAQCETVVEPGDFILYAGGSSKEEDLISINIAF
ncbi:MAG: glycoside hydrolase family 3 C-terminal domain-containing protein [Clostridiales bacterium]|nr:glycoside hydrolase family 3 C-terminal domain-containing protein [Clostridiales bacterium]